MTTGGFFLSKKQKKLMQARRKKKKQHQKHQRQETTSSFDEDRPSSKRQCTEESRRQQSSQPSSNSSSNASSSSPLPAASAASVSTPQEDKDTTMIRKVVIPSDATAKEAKKLRKEARRKARSEGWPENKILFVDEKERPLPGQEQQLQPEENDAARQARRTNAATATTKKHPDNNINKKRKVFPRINDILQEEAKKAEQQARVEARKATEDALSDEIKNRYVALDCEMVGTGVDGKISVLARVSLVDWSGSVMLDTFVQVPTRVTDFRTQWSGITASKIQSHTGAMAVDTCRKRVAALIKGKILVGHALKNDLDALLLTHPKEDIRDTAKYRFYQRLWNNKWRPRKLRDLVLEHCDMVIQQEGDGGAVGHDSVDDARASMELFKVAREAWEKELEQKKQKRARKK